MMERKNRKRNRNRDDHRAAPAPQENQNHQSGEAGGNQAFAQHAVDGGAHEQRLVGERLDLQFRRDLGLNSRQHGFDTGNDVQGRGVPGLLDGQQGSSLSVYPHNVGLGRETVAHVGHVTDVDGRAAYSFDGKVIQFGDSLRAAVQVDVIFELSDLGGSGGQDQILSTDGVDHIHRREPLRLQRIGV